jgi:hypothetical protein
VGARWPAPEGVGPELRPVSEKDPERPAGERQAHHDVAGRTGWMALCDGSVMVGEE